MRLCSFSIYLDDSYECPALVGAGLEQVPGAADGTTEAQRGEGTGLRSHSELGTQLGLEFMALSQSLPHCMAQGCLPAKSKGIGGVKEIENMTSVLRVLRSRQRMSCMYLRQ